MKDNLMQEMLDSANRMIADAIMRVLGFINEEGDTKLLVRSSEYFLNALSIHMATIYCLLEKHISQELRWSENEIKSNRAELLANVQTSLTNRLKYYDEQMLNKVAGK